MQQKSLKAKLRMMLFFHQAGKTFFTVDATNRPSNWKDGFIFHTHEACLAKKM